MYRTVNYITFKGSAFLRVIPILSLTLLLGCTKQNRTDLTIQDETLAKINDLSISVSHFETSFKEYFYRTGQVLAPDKQTRKAILENEFHTYVLATYAIQDGISDSEEAKKREKAIVRRVLTEEYNAQVIVKDVRVSEQDLREYFQRFNTRVRASHLYAATRSEIQTLKNRLDAGESFEQLAKKAFKNSELAKNGGDLGWFTTDDMDVSFEEAAFSLSMNRISEPVQTAQGYSIIKVTDRVQKPILTEQEFNQHRDRLFNYVQKKKNELRTREHLNQFMESCEWNESVTQSLWNDFFRNQTAVLAQDEEFLRTLSHDTEMLLKFNDFVFTISDFIEEYSISTAIRKSSISNEDSFKAFLLGAAYRVYMVREAKRLKIDQQSEVVESIQETYLHMLESLAVEHLRATIQNTPAELYNEFFAAPERYATPLYLNLQRIIVDNQEIAESVRSLALNGVNYDDLVREYTTNGEERLRNGEIGFTSIHDFGVNTTMLATLEIGEISKVIPYLSTEYHVYKVIGREESRQLTFDEAKEWVDEILTEKKLKTLKAATIEQVKLQNDAFMDLDKLNSLAIRI